MSITMHTWIIHSTIFYLCLYFPHATGKSWRKLSSLTAVDAEQEAFILKTNAGRLRVSGGPRESRTHARFLIIHALSPRDLLVFSGVKHSRVMSDRSMERPLFMFMVQKETSYSWHIQTLQRKLKTGVKWEKMSELRESCALFLVGFQWYFSHLLFPKKSLKICFLTRKPYSKASSTAMNHNFWIKQNR